MVLIWGVLKYQTSFLAIYPFIQEHCFHYQEDMDELRNMTAGSEEYEELFAELAELVCNREEKGYCCSTIAPNQALVGFSDHCCL